MSRTYVIYKIKSLDQTIDYCYVGSTQNFIKRKSQHKCVCNVIKEKNNTKLYNTMRENGGWDNFQMTPIEEYKCDTPQQAHIREQYWIENIEKNKLNSIKAFVTKEQKLEQQKEYYSANKDKIADYQKEYKAVNKEKVADYQKEYSNEYYHKVTLF